MHGNLTAADGNGRQLLTAVSSQYTDHRQHRCPLQVVEVLLKIVEMLLQVKEVQLKVVEILL